MPSTNPTGPGDWCPPQTAPRPAQDRRTFVAAPQPAGSLCHLGWRPLLLTGALRRLAVNHFSDPGHIEDPALRGCIWHDDESTGILIESVHRWTGSLVEKRPAVLLKRNAYRNVRIGLNDFLGSDTQGNDDFTTLWVGSHTLFCIHGSGAGCEILATEVQREVTQFAPAVRRRLGLVKFSVTEVGAVSEVEESALNYLVPVTVGWAYQESWKLVPEALPLKAVDLVIRPSEV